MISMILFIYIGVRISAPWWYYTLLGCVFIARIFNFALKVGKKAGEQTHD